MRLRLLGWCPGCDQGQGPSPDRKEYLEEGEVKPQVFLSAAEERELARRYRQGNEKAGHKLACAYLPLVKRIAAEFFGSREDLVSEGCVGLMKAIKLIFNSDGRSAGRKSLILLDRVKYSAKM